MDSDLERTHDVDPFAGIAGQPVAVAALRAAVGSPAHAHLLVGRAGLGTVRAAALLAGELVAAADPEGDPGRHRRLAASGNHPAITVVERVGASITVPQVQDVVRAANLSPAEGTLQVFVLTDFHRVGLAAPTLLKTLEEPPASTAFVIVADEVTEELVTIASRCVRIDFGPVPVQVVVQSLVDAGVDPEVAAVAAASSGGDLERAALLASDPALAARRAVWAALPGRLDGTGTRIAELADEALAAIDTVITPIATLHTAEREQLDDEIEQLGLRRGLVKDLEERHKREVRRIRADELRAGLAALIDSYRTDLGSPGATERFVAAGEAVATLERRLAHNPNERLAVLALLVDLPSLVDLPPLSQESAERSVRASLDET